MKVFLNILWYFPYFGFLLAIPMAIFGLLLCATVVGLPLGLGLLQIAKFLLAPHTYEMVTQKSLSEAKGEERSPLWIAFNAIVSILYIPIGICLVVIYVLVAICEFLTILGIPNGLVIVKLIPSIFNPVGKVCVGGAIARKIQADKDSAKVDRYFANTPAGQTKAQAEAAARIQQQPQPQAVASIPAMPEIKSNPVLDYSYEKITEVLAKPHLYNPEIVRLCTEEKEVRDNIEAVMPEVEGMDIDRLSEIVRSPETYSAVMVRCAQIQIKRHEAKLAQENAERERQLELQRQAEIAAEQQRRKEQSDAMKAWLMKWKFAIGGAAGAVIGLCIILWLTSDGHRLSVAKDAFQEGNYAKVTETAMKIDNKNSKHYSDAIILGFTAARAMNEEKAGTEFASRLLSLKETTTINDQNLAGHIFYWQEFYKVYIESKDSTDLSPYWLDMAKAFDNAELKNSSNANMAKFTAAYAYFMGTDYERSIKLFRELKDVSRYEFFLHDYVDAYIGLMNLYQVCPDPNPRVEGWPLLKNAPLSGIFAMYKGDAYLADIKLSLKNRLTQAADCYNYIDLNASSWTIDYTVDVVNEKKSIVENLINAYVWNLQGYNYDNGKGSYQGQLKVYNYTEQPHGWGVFTYNYSDNQYINYGKFRYSKDVIAADSSLCFFPISDGVIFDLRAKNVLESEFWNSPFFLTSSTFENQVSMLSWDVFPIEIDEYYD